MHSARIAGQELVAMPLNGGKIELSYLRYVADHYPDMDTAKANAPTYAISVLADRQSKVLADENCSESAFQK